MLEYFLVGQFTFLWLHQPLSVVVTSFLTGSN